MKKTKPNVPLNEPFSWCGSRSSCPIVRHGDVYEISTTNAELCPLPDLRLLQIQYDIQKIVAGIHAARAPEIIFRDGLPSDDGSLPTYDVGCAGRLARPSARSCRCPCPDAGSGRPLGTCFYTTAYHRLPSLRYRREQAASRRA